MKLFFIIDIDDPMPLISSEKSRTDYLDLLKQYPHLLIPQGNVSKGKIEILIDPDKMTSIEKSHGRAVGVIWHDQYWLWINDACRFPTGYEGIHA